MEISDADHLDCSSHQSLLAGGARRELGAWHVFPRATRGAGLAVFADVPHCRSSGHLLSDAPFAAMLGAAATATRRSNSRQDAGATKSAVATAERCGRYKKQIPRRAR